MSYNLSSERTQRRKASSLVKSTAGTIKLLSLTLIEEVILKIMENQESNFYLVMGSMEAQAIPAICR